MSGLIYVNWVWHQLCYQWRGKQMLSTILVMLKQQRSVLLLLRLTLLWHDKSKHCLRVSLDIPASQTLTPWDKAFCHLQTEAKYCWETDLPPVLSEVWAQPTPMKAGHIQDSYGQDLWPAHLFAPGSAWPQFHDEELCLAARIVCDRHASSFPGRILFTDVLCSLLLLWTGLNLIKNPSTKRFQIPPLTSGVLLQGLRLLCSSERWKELTWELLWWT